MSTNAKRKKGGPSCSIWARFTQERSGVYVGDNFQCWLASRVQEFRGSPSPDAARDTLSGFKSRNLLRNWGSKGVDAACDESRLDGSFGVKVLTRSSDTTISSTVCEIWLNSSSAVSLCWCPDVEPEVEAFSRRVSRRDDAAAAVSSQRCNLWLSFANRRLGRYPKYERANPTNIFSHKSFSFWTSPACMLHKTGSLRVHKQFVSCPLVDLPSGIWAVTSGLRYLTEVAGRTLRIRHVDLSAHHFLSEDHLDKRRLSNSLISIILASVIITCQY